VHEVGNATSAPVGALSFSKNNPGLLQAVNEQLRHYIGSDDHRARMAKYGFTRTEDRWSGRSPNSEELAASSVARFDSGRAVGTADPGMA
jgi:hypothetical protein